MPRTARHIVPEQPHHFVKRGNNREAMFRDPADVARCLLSLHEASQKYDCQIHAYAVMTNHLHLLATPLDAMSAARFIQSFGVRYARYFNSRYERTGTLWEERYHSEWVDSERYFFDCSRYIELNPVRARMVEHPIEFAASSFRRNAFGESNALVTPHPLYESLAPTDSERAHAYRAIFKNHLDDDSGSAQYGPPDRPWRRPK